VKIGYLVEGSTDRAVVRALAARLCPKAQLVEGAFRGSLKGSGRKRELPKACAALREMGADVIVDLNDANEMAWHQRRDQERAWTPPELHHLVVIGAPKPNVEAWLVADAAHFERTTGQSCRPAPQDPKALVERAFAVTGGDRKEDEIAAFVRAADLEAWSADASFGGFMAEARDKAVGLGCALDAP
jgi:hypothetical protein